MSRRDVACYVPTFKLGMNDNFEYDRSRRDFQNCVVGATGNVLQHAMPLRGIELGDEK